MHGKPIKKPRRRQTLDELRPGLVAWGCTVEKYRRQKNGTWLCKKTGSVMTDEFEKKLRGTWVKWEKC